MSSAYIMSTNISLKLETIILLFTIYIADKALLFIFYDIGMTSTHALLLILILLYAITRIFSIDHTYTYYRKNILNSIAKTECNNDEYYDNAQKNNKKRRSQTHESCNLEDVPSVAFEMYNENDHVNTKIAALLLKVKPNTLEHWRSQKITPRPESVKKNGRVTYTIKALKDYLIVCENYNLKRKSRS